MYLTALLSLSLSIPVNSPINPDSLVTSPATPLDEAIVTGTRSATTARHLPATVNVIGHERLTIHQRQDILSTLSQEVPGLFVTQRALMGYGVSGGGSGAISMRGVSSGTGQLLVLIDGHPQYQGIYGHSLADSYNTLTAERIEVLRGPASVLYGSNAMGGVINIITRQALEDGVKTHIGAGAGSFGTFQAEATNRFRKGKFSSTVGGQYGRSDNHLPRMGFEQGMGYARMDYRIHPAWKAFGDVSLTRFSAHCPFRTDVKNGELVVGDLYEGEQWITRGAAAFGVENHYLHTDGRISGYSNWGRHKINDGYGPTYHNNTPQTTFFRSSDGLSGIAAYQSMDLWKGSRLTLGMDYQHILAHAYYTNRETGEVQPAGKTSVDKTMDEFAAYVDYRQEITNWLTLDAGIRYDHHTVSGAEWIPQAGLVISPYSDATLRLTAGKGFRNPNAKEMYLYGMANDELQPERLWNYEIAWQQQASDGRIAYGFNLFWIKGDNIIQTVGGRNLNTGEFTHRGVEGEFTWRVNRHWQLSTHHAYLNMKQPLVAAPAYNGNLTAIMRYGHFTAAATLQQVCGLYTSVATNPPLKEDFRLLNVTLGYQVLRPLQLWVKGENLLGERYEINAGFPMSRTVFMAGVNVDF